MNHKYGPYSFSRLSLCPRSYELKYRKREKGIRPTRFGTAVGTAKHELAEIILSPKYNNHEVEDLVQRYIQKYQKYQEFAHELVEDLNLFKSEFNRNLDDFVGSEVNFGLNLKMESVGYDNPEAWFRGKIDYVEINEDNIARVVDFKNYPSIHSNASLVNTKEGVGKQLMCYACGVFAEYEEVDYVAIEVYYFRYGVSKQPMIDNNVMLISRGEAEEFWKGIVLSMVAKERATAFPALPSQKQCQYCEYTHKCTAVKNITFIESQDDASKIIDELLVLEEQVKRKRGLLQKYVKANGPVKNATGANAEYALVEKVKIDPKLFFEACAQNNLDPFDYVSIPKSSIDKAKKKSDNESLYVTEKESSTRWKIS